MSQNNAPTPAGSASQTASVNAGGAPTLVTGNVMPNNEFTVTIVTGSSPVNSGTNNLIIATLTPYKAVSLLSAAVVDQTNTTLTSDLNTGNATGLADFNRYINLAGLTVGYIRIVTTDTTLYNNKLKFGILPYNGSTLAAYWPLANYAQNGSSGYAKNLTINTMPNGGPMVWPITKQTYLFFDTLPASATITLTFGIIGTGENNLNS